MKTGGGGHRQVERFPGWRARVVRFQSRMTTPRDLPCAGYCNPAERISYAVWLYFCFP
jgi:hypothetical protein